MSERELRRVKIEEEQERASLSNNDKGMKKEKYFNKKMNKIKTKLKSFNMYHEKKTLINREIFNINSVNILEGCVSHSMLNVVEYAPSVNSEVPSMYIGFNHIEKNDSNLTLYEHGNIKYKTQSASKYRYMFEFDTYETALQWQRTFKPWMSELKKKSTA